MQFGVLGPLEARSSDTAVELGPRKQRLLLLALLTTPGTVRSTDQLIDDVWAEDPPGNPGTSLRAYLSNLRKIIEPQRAAGSKPTMLLRRGDGYVLSVDDSTIDARVFEQQLDTARSLADPDRVVDTLRSAIALWRGDAFHDARFSDFAAAETQRLHGLRSEARTRLAEALIQIGRPTEAIADLDASIIIDPFDEGLRALLARALYAAGRQTDALKAIDDARTMLVEELGLDPGPALRTLEQQILEHDPALNAPAARTLEPAVAASPVTASRLPGRDAELTSLIESLDHVRQTGDGLVAVVSGPAGAGKTRLVEEFLGPATSRGAVAVWARSDEGATGLALWPWATALHDALDGRSEDEAARALGSDRAAIASFVPALRGLGDTEPVDIHRFHVFDAVVRVLKRLADEQPLVIVLDDVHWADDTSLELAAFMAKRLSGLPIMIVATSRESDHPHIADLKHRADRANLPLGPLSRTGLRSMVDSAFGASPGNDAIVDVLIERTGGNPFFAEQILRSLDSENAVESATAVAAPSTVAAALTQQLAGLHDDVRELLSVASAAKADWTLDITAEVAGFDLDRGLDAVETAMRAGLAEEVPDRIGAFRFGHSLVAETLYNSLSSMRRARMHARLGELIEARRPLDDPITITALAWHYERGVPAGTELSAVRWANSAAQQAIERHDPASALDIARNAIAMLEGTARSDERTRHLVHLLCTKSEAERRCDDVTAAHRSARSAWDEAQLTGDISLRAKAALVYSGDGPMVFWMGYWYDEELSAVMIDQVLSEAADGELDPKLIIRLLNRLADARHDGLPNGQGDAITRQSIERAQEIGDAHLLMDSQRTRLRCAHFGMTSHERLELADQMLELSQQVGSEPHELFATRMGLGEAFEQGDAVLVEARLAGLCELAERATHEAVEFVATWLPLSVDVFRGDFAAAERGMASVVSRYGHFEESMRDGLNLLIVQILRERHQMDQIEALIRQRLSGQPSPAWRAPLLLLLAEHERFDEAKGLLAEMPASDFTSTLEVPLQFMTPCHAADAVAHLGDVAHAQLLIGFLEDHADRLVNFSSGMQYHGWVGFYVGRLCTTLGRLDDAEQFLSAVADKAAAIGAFPHGLRCAVALAEVSLARGDTNSIRTLEALAARARDSDLDGTAAWADRLVRSAG